MEEDLAREIFYQKKIKEQENSTEVFKNFNQFFFKTGRFPGSNNLAIIPSGIIPAFVKTKDIISPSDLYETFKDSNAYGLVSTQFLAALNIYFNCDKLLSKNVMTEFLHNLSLQALNRDHDRVQLKFAAIIALNRKLKALIRDNNRNRLSFVEFRPEKFKQVKDISQKIEEEVAILLQIRESNIRLMTFLLMQILRLKLKMKTKQKMKLKKKRCEPLMLRMKKYLEI